MRSPAIHLKMSRQLLREVDEAAKALHTSRSAFIRDAIIMRLNDQRLVKKARPREIIEMLMQADAPFNNPFNNQG